MRRAFALMFLCLFPFMALGCRTPARQPAAPAPPATLASPPVPAPPRQRDDCGTRPDDWCAGPAGDPCGAHKDVASCRADSRCGGRAYAGESVVACRFDARGFGENCPTVGCVSLQR